MNSARLKLELLCRGAALAPNARLEEDARPVKRTRGGLGSGIDAILPGGVWVNIPVAEPFAQTSPYLIDLVSGEYILRHGVDEVCRLKFPRPAPWYAETTSSGKPIGGIGVIQGNYFAVHPSELCDFWKREPRRNCRFCSIGLCHGQTESAEKSVEDVIQAARKAYRHEKIPFVHFNTGHAEDDGAIDRLLPYVESLKRASGLLVGVQCPPSPDLSKYDRLKKLGVDHVSFCFEIFDPEKFVEVCPGKAEHYGRRAAELRGDPGLEAARELARRHLKDAEPHPGQLIFYRALAHCLKLWGKGPVAGEIVAGLEPPERSIQAVEFLAECGAVTTVCVFRPCIGTDYENRSPPTPEELAPVFARQYEVCVERGIPTGVASIRTAMVHTQMEGRIFSREGHGRWPPAPRPKARELSFHAKMTLAKVLYRARCSTRIKQDFAEPDPRKTRLDRP